LKHASDLFDQRRAELRKQFKTQGMAEEDIEIDINDPNTTRASISTCRRVRAGIRVGKRPSWRMA
jgi:hypothetical protein